MAYGGPYTRNALSHTCDVCGFVVTRPYHDVCLCPGSGTPGTPRIAVTFEIVTQEGDDEDPEVRSGWDVTPEDAEALEWDTDPDAEESAVTAAVRFLRDEGNGNEPSASAFTGPGVWYSDTEARQDCAFFERGEEYRRSFHLYGFTPDQERDVYAAITARMVGILR